jgi:hypothetical protein
MGYSRASSRRITLKNSNSANVQIIITPLTVSYYINYIAVAGGGGGGISGGALGAGGSGGAGGAVVGSMFIPSTSTPVSMTITVGAGGSGGTTGAGGTGSNTTISSTSLSTGSLIALGGGGGGPGGGPPYNGGTGGSGGGGGNSSPPLTNTGWQPTMNAGLLYATNYGNPGWGDTSPTVGAGGGGALGAGGPGGPGSPTPTGAGGGAGIVWAYTSSLYAKGGNANPNGWTAPSTGAPGAINTGGGGTNATGSGNPGGGAGGSGVVSLAIPTVNWPGPGSYTGSNVIVTTPPAAPGMTVITYNSPGTYTK